MHALIISNYSHSSLHFLLFVLAFRVRRIILIDILCKLLPLWFIKEGCIHDLEAWKSTEEWSRWPLDLGGLGLAENYLGWLWLLLLLDLLLLRSLSLLSLWLELLSWLLLSLGLFLRLVLFRDEGFSTWVEAFRCCIHHLWWCLLLSLNLGL